MLLILRLLSTREARQNPPESDRTTNKKRFEIADTADPKNLPGEYRGGKGADGGGFQIQNLIERLEESRIGAANRKGQRSERSQEVVENKGKCFFHTRQSQEVPENKGVIFVKPRGY